MTPAGNQIGAAGAQRLAEAVALAAPLAENKCLASLQAAQCGIEAAGSGALALALYTNCALRRLGLSGNHIGESGVAAFVAHLAGNAALMELNLRGSGAPADGQAALQRLVAPPSLGGGWHRSSTLSVII